MSKKKAKHAKRAAGWGDADRVFGVIAAQSVTRLLGRFARSEV